MHSKLNCDPADILAVIGPAIGACCYEVDEAVIAPCDKLTLLRAGRPRKMANIC